MLKAQCNGSFDLRQSLSYQGCFDEATAKQTARASGTAPFSFAPCKPGLLFLTAADGHFAFPWLKTSDSHTRTEVYILYI